MIESKIKEKIPLAPLTTFKIGGPAKYYVEAKTKEDLVEAIEWAENIKENIYLLSGGSNVLVADKGVDGLVIKMANTDLKIKGRYIESEAGCPLPRLISICHGANLSGFEWAVGIPGTVGGAIRGNAGAHGFSTSDNVETVDVFDKSKKIFIKMSRNECDFSYRESIFKRNQNLIIWSAEFKLDTMSSEMIKKSVDKNLKFRNTNQPKSPSAGSVFKNISIEDLNSQNKNMAELAKVNKAVKNNAVPAGWVIDFLGLKGKTIGGAKISLEHANFIINTGKATAEDVMMLISFIKQQARVKVGVQLYEEIQYFGI